MTMIVTVTARRLLAALLLCLMIPCAAHAAAPEAAPVIGSDAPPLLGKDRDGNQVDLAAHRGKVVIVTFWASWCGYCLKELPALNALQSRVSPDLLATVAVNVKDDTGTYRAMTRQMRDYQLLLTRDPHGSIAERYGVKSYPNLWIVDPQGRVASHHVGYGEDSLTAIIDEINRLLAEEFERQQALKRATGVVPASAPAG